MLTNLQINSNSNLPNNIRQQDYIADTIYNIITKQAQQTQLQRNQQRNLQQSAQLAKPFAFIGYQPQIGYRH